ncbi:hypothetical protein PoB_002854600 [Plakobranchus ocellatus]|uniref:Uncharacterized protein n=1 Tax=Plakobranchus ocellatus TaxID=259542 RepID=A0AAV4A5X0_9GAST|nr:hypothetical protein PoB_002854600 [Plakobranchus ocellatus]
MTSIIQQVHNGRGRHKIGENGRYLQRDTFCSEWTKPPSNQGSEDDLPLAKLTEKADEDDLPLSVIQSSLRLVSAMVATKNPPSEVDEPEKYSTDSISPQQAEKVYHELTIEDYKGKTTHVTKYDFLSYAPCHIASLEIDDEATQFDFMDETSILDDTAQDPDFVPNYKEDSDDSVFDTNDSPVDENKITDEMRPEENKEMRTEDSRDPSAFPVEGEPRESVSESGTPRKRKTLKTEREIRKERHNEGCEYTTESGKKMPKKSVGVRCKSSRCRDREFYCH